MTLDKRRAALKLGLGVGLGGAAALMSSASQATTANKNIIYLSNIGELENMPLDGISSKQVVFVGGYYIEGDGGGGHYYYDSSCNISENGGTIIAANGVGRWLLTSTDVLNVAQFGAIGNGADEASKIQNALSALSDNGKLIFGNGKTYLLGSLMGQVIGSAVLEVSNKSNIEICGNQCKFVTTGLKETFIALCITGCKNVDIHGINIDCGFVDWSEGYNTHQFGMVVDNSSDVDVHHNKVENISNVALGVTGDILNTNPDHRSVNIRVTNNTFKNFGQTSTSFTGCDDVSFESNTYINFHLQAIKLASKNQNTRASVSDNKIYFTDGFIELAGIGSMAAILVQSSYEQVVISNNQIDLSLVTSTPATAIFVGGNEGNGLSPERVLVTNNMISGLNSAGSSGIAFHEGIDSIDILNNVIDSKHWGIRCEPVPSNLLNTAKLSANFVISSNRISNFSQVGINFASTVEANSITLRDNLVETQQANYGVYAGFNSSSIVNKISFMENDIRGASLGFRLVGGQINQLRANNNDISNEPSSPGQRGIFYLGDNQVAKVEVKGNVISHCDKGVYIENAKFINYGQNTFDSVHTCATINNLPASTTPITGTSINNSNILLDSYIDNCVVRLQSNSTLFGVFRGKNSPNGVVDATYGSLWLTDSYGTTQMYIKESLSGSSGWVPK